MFRRGTSKSVVPSTLVFLAPSLSGHRFQSSAPVDRPPGVGVGQDMETPEFEPTTGDRRKPSPRHRTAEEQSDSMMWLQIRMNAGFMWAKGELNKGFGSRFVLFGYGCLLLLATYRFMERVIFPALDELTPTGRGHPAPMSTEHNAFFNLMQHKETIPNPNTMAWDETCDRPGLLGSIPSGLHNVHHDEEGKRRPAQGGEAHTEIAVMQQQDWDPYMKEDYYFRSMHTITTHPPSTAKGEKPWERRHDPAGVFNRWQRAPIGGGGDLRIGGMIRCKAITSSDNCIPDITCIETEVYRKLLLCLAPVFILRDCREDFIPKRMLKDYKWRHYNVLYLGLGTGFIPSYFQRAMPQFNIDVVENDPAVIRVARRFFGFRETTGNTGTRLFLEEPTEYVRKFLAERKVRGPKPDARSVVPFTLPKEDKDLYKLVMLDCMTDPSGRVPLKYTRLDFLSNLRQSMAGSGVLVANIPNDNDRIFKTVVENIRMAFEGKTVILIHCATSPNTILMTFNDMPKLFEDTMGAFGNVQEFREMLMNTMKAKMGIFRHDACAEIGEHNFTQLLPGVKYTYDRGLRTQAEYEGKLKQEYEKMRKTDGVIDSFNKMSIGEATNEGKRKTIFDEYPTWGSWFQSATTQGMPISSLDAHLRHTPKEFDEVKMKHTGFSATPVPEPTN